MSNKSKVVDATLAPYANVLRHWPKAAGTPVTAAELATIHAMNIRPGKHALANAMYSRAEGATDQQVRLAAGKLDAKGGLQGSLFNYMRLLINDGLMSRDMSTPGLYKITLTKKGEAQRDRYVKATAPAATHTVETVKPVKAKAKRKAKAVETVAPEAEPATVDHAALAIEAAFEPPQG